MDYQRDMRQSQKDVGDKIPSNYISVLFACIYTICLCNLLIILFANEKKLLFDDEIINFFFWQVVRI